MLFRDRLKLKGINLEEKTSERSSEYLIELWHEFMKFYNCWIPFKEFISMPISLTLSLLDKINRDREVIIPQPVIIMGMAKKEDVNRMNRNNRAAIAARKIGGVHG